METKSDYNKNQLECLITLRQKCGTAVWGYCEVFPIPSTRMICYVMLKLLNTRDHQNENLLGSTVFMLPHSVLGWPYAGTKIKQELMYLPSVLGV